MARGPHGGEDEGVRVGAAGVVGGGGVRGVDARRAFATCAVCGEEDGRETVLPCQAESDGCYALLMGLKEQLDRADAARDSAWDAIVGPITVVDSRSQV